MGWTGVTRPRRESRRDSAGGARPVSGILPLQALVAREDRIADIVAPQYEFIPRGDRYGYAVRRPDSFVNIILSVRDFPPPPPTRAAVARRAADHFDAMLARACSRPFRPRPSSSTSSTPAGIASWASWPASRCPRSQRVG